MDSEEPRTNSPEDIGFRSAPPPVMPKPKNRARDEEPPPAPKDEGARSFAVLLQQIDEGALHTELSETARSVVNELVDYMNRYQRSGKGTLTLTLSFETLPTGAVHVHGDVKTKTPKAKRAGSMFFRTPGNNLSLDNPRQQKLPLTALPSAKEPPRVLAEDRPVRTL